MKKFFTSAVVVLTIIWAAGLASFVPTAQAVALNSGDLIKASLPAVYYYGADAKRYVFPDEKTYMTWYSDFSSVITITDAELATIPIGGNVTYRPGVKLVKITTDPKVYAVEQNGELRWVTTEAVASCLYGSSWGTMVNDVPDPFFVNYTIGDSITDCAQYDPSAASAASPTINVDKGLAEGSAAGITASLASDNPAGSTLPLNGTGVQVLKLNLGGSGTVTNLTFKTEGVGTAGDIANAYLYKGATRLTSGKSFNTTTKEATFNVSLTVPVTLSLVIDVSGTATAGDEHTFALKAINNEAVGGVMGNTFTIGSQAVSNVTIAPAAVPSNPQVGTKNAELANFKITGGVNDAVINSITLTQIGSINSEDLSNFVLKVAGSQVASADMLDGDKLVLVFNTPFELLSGANKTFTLYGDVAGRPGRTISFYLDETQDLVVIDSLYGFGATVTSTFTAGTMAITSEGGELTLAFNGPITGDVSKGAQDVELFNFTATSASALTVRNTYIELDGATGTDLIRGSLGTDYFTDIKLIDADSGQVLAGPVSLTAAGVLAGAQNSGVLTLTDDWSIDGTRNLSITADTASAEDALGEFFGSTYSVTLGQPSGTNVIFTGGADVKYQDSNDYVVGSDIVPNTPVIGNAQTVLAASLTVNASSYVGNSTHVKGATDAAISAYAFTAGTDSSARITRLIFNPRVDTSNNGTLGEAGTDVTADNIAVTAKLWQITGSGWVQLDGTKSVQFPVGGLAGSETITFDNFEVVVPAGDSIVLAVSANLSTSFPFATNPGPELLEININAAGNILAYDKDDNGVTATLAATPLIGAQATIDPVGTIEVTSDIADPAYKSRLVQMGSAGEAALRIKARSSNEPFAMKKGLFTVTGATANILSVKVSYPTDAAQTTYVTQTGAIAGGVTQFSGMNWYIPADIDSYMDVTITVNNDTNGALSGNNVFNLQLEAQNADFAGGVTQFLGMSSSSFATVNSQLADVDSVSNALYARKSLITLDKNAASPSGTGIPGLDKYLRINVTNGGNTNVNIFALTLRLNSADTAGTDWVCAGNLPVLPATQDIQLYDVNNLGTALVAATAGTTVNGCVGAGADAVEYRLTFIAPTYITIPANSTKTFTVEVDTSNADAAGDDTFRIDVTSGDPAAVTIATDDFVWNDGIVPTTTANNNGFLVENLPVNGGNFVF